MSTYKINEEKLRRYVSQGMTDKQIGIVVGLSRRHVNFLRNLFLIAPGSQPEKKPVGAVVKVTLSPANHPEVEGLCDTYKTVRQSRMERAEEAFSKAMAGRGHVSLNIPQGPIPRFPSPSTANVKSAMANFESF